MARRYSSPRSTTFVGPQTLPVTPAQIGWLPKWQDPVRLLVAATAISIAFCPQPPKAAVPNAIPPQAQQASPTLLAARVAWNDFAWAPQPAPNLPITPSHVGWYQRWQDPVRLLVPSTDCPRAWNPQLVVLPVTPSQMGWPAQQAAPTLLPPRAVDPIYAWSPKVVIFTTPVPYGWAASQFAPTLLTPRALDPQFAWNPRALSLPVTPSQFGFWTPFHEIIRTPDRRDSVVAWSPQSFAAAPVPYGWIAAQFAPTLLPSRATDSPYIWTPKSLSLPITPSQFGFWQQFHEIVRTPDRRDSVFAWEPQFIFQPIRFGWWTPQYASDPVHLLARATPSDLIWTPEPLPLPVTPSQFGWWRPWHDPVRLPGRGDVVTPWYPQIVVPVANDWLVSPYSSVIPSLVCSSASVVPALVCYGGAVAENETYMSQLLPFQIQQPFILFPNNGIPVLWSLIVGSTWNTTQTPVTDATGTLTIEDQNGNAVYSAAFIPTATAGTYQAMINGASFDPSEGINYTSVISFTSPSISQPGLWTVPTIIRFRTTP